MNFRIDETAVRASVAAAYAEKQASHPGEPLSVQELRAIALDALIDAMLTPPNGLIHEALYMIGSANYAAQELREKGFWTFAQPPGDLIVWRDKDGVPKEQRPPQVEHRVLDKDLPAFAAHYKLDAEEMRRLGRAEIHDYNGWRRGGVYSKPFELTVMYTPSQEERIDPASYAEIVAEAQGLWDSRNDHRPHPLARPIQMPTANPMEPIVFNPSQPDAPLPFSWQPGMWGPQFPDPDAPKLPAGVESDGPVHAAEEPKRNRFGRRGK